MFGDPVEDSRKRLVSDSASARASRQPAGLAGLAWDVALPLVGYYTLHLLGASDWLALLAATAAAGVRLIWVALATKRITWFAAVMLAVFGLGLVFAFVRGDPRFLLLKDSFSTAMLALIFLVSLATARPMTLSAAQTFRPTEATHLGELYQTDPAARRVFRISALGWGIGLLIEATLRVPLIYLLPVDVAVGLSTAMMITAMIAIATWNVAYVTSAARRNPVLQVLLPPSTRRRGGQAGA